MIHNTLNIATLVTSILLVFVLSILPGKPLKKNIHLLIVICFFIGHLVSMQLHWRQFIPTNTYAYLSIAHGMGYAVAFYFYLKALHGHSTKYFLINLLLGWSGLVVLFILRKSEVTIDHQWLFSTYYTLILLYFLVRTVLVYRREKRIQHESWVITCFWGFGFLVTLYVVEAVWINVALENYLANSLYGVILFFAWAILFMLVTLYQIINTPAIFSNVRLRISNGATAAQVSKIELGLVVNYVEESRAYLNADLSRNQISEETGLSVNRISEIVNGVYQMNFNDWVNKYRIETAKALLEKPDLSIKETLHQAGFNSKSAFNLAFKKWTGMTPSEFRKSLR